MAWWSRSKGPDPDRDSVRRGEDLGDVERFDPPPYEGPPGHDPAALSRLTDRLARGGTVPAGIFLTGCHLRAALDRHRDESEFLAVVEHLNGRRDVHQVLVEASPGDLWPHTDALLVVTAATPAQVMAWFDADEVDRLGPKTPLVRDLVARSEVPFGFSVIRARWVRPVR